MDPQNSAGWAILTKNNRKIAHKIVVFPNLFTIPSLFSQPRKAPLNQGTAWLKSESAVFKCRNLYYTSMNPPRSSISFCPSLSPLSLGKDSIGQPQTATSEVSLIGSSASGTMTPGRAGAMKNSEPLKADWNGRHTERWPSVGCPARRQGPSGEGI